MLNFLKNKKVERVLKVSLVLLVIFVAVVALFPEQADAGLRQDIQDLVNNLKNGFSDIGASFLDQLVKFFKWAIAYIGYAFLQMNSWILGVSAMVLNLIIQFGILDMGTIIADSGSGSAITTGWVILRDMVNLLFIFGILYIAINTIIQGWTQNSKERLRNIIVAALLINFSFFFTSILIDASNILSISLYEQMSQCEQDQHANVLEADVGIANCFLSALRLQTIFDPDPESISSGEEQSIISSLVANNSLASLVLVLTISGVFVLVTAIVFFAMAIIILVRFVALIFLLITSPAMFLGWVIPQLKGITDYWRSKLVDNLVALPVMFLFLYITYLLILSPDSALTTSFRAMQLDVTTGNFAAAFGEEISSASSVNGAAQPVNAGVAAIVNFLIVISFLIGSLTASKKLGAFAADEAQKWSGRIVAGGAARLGRETFGRLGRATSKSSALKRVAASRAPIVNRLARGVIAGGEAAAKGSFDIRGGAKVVPGVAAALKAAQVDLGDAQKGGINKEIEERSKKRKKTEEKYKRTVSDGSITQGELDKLDSEDDFTNEADREEFKKLTSELERLREELAGTNWEKEIGDAQKEEQDFLEIAGDTSLLQTERDAAKKEAADARAKVADLQSRKAKAEARMKKISGTPGSKSDIGELGKVKERAIQDGDLERSPGLKAFGIVPGKVTTGAQKLLGTDFGVVGEEAKKSIRKDLRKNKDQKAVDDLKKALKPSDSGGGKSDSGDKK